VVVGDDPVPVVEPVELPEGVVDDVEPAAVVVELDGVVDVESVGDWLVPTVVALVDGCVPFAVRVEPSAGCVVVLEPSGVAPPPPIVADVPPVAGAFRLVGILTTVVDVVTVIGMAPAAADVVGAIRTCGCGAAVATAGAASSVALTVE
jgi:hypothetical protein